MGSKFTLKCIFRHGCPGSYRLSYSWMLLGGFKA